MDLVTIKKASNQFFYPPKPYTTQTDLSKAKKCVIKSKAWGKTFQ